MKYFNSETTYESIKNHLRGMLKQNNIYYELSGCGYNNYHFEIKCTDEQKDQINNYLDYLYENRLYLE